MGIRPLRAPLFFLLLPLLVCTLSCNRELVPALPNPGIIDIQSYRAFGDGFSVGFTNTGQDIFSSQGLYAEGQASAWPLLMSLQFGMPPGDFRQNLASETGSGYFVLAELGKQDNCSEADPIPLLEPVSSTPNWSRPSDPEATYHNLSLPHLRVGWVNSDSFGRSSPFFQRMPQPVQPDYLSLIAGQEFEFFSLWLGTEDVLDAALSGMAIATHLPLSPAEFTEKFTLLLESCARSNNQNRIGVIGNLPDITRFSYFTRQGHMFQSWEDCIPRQKQIYIQTGDPARPVRVAEAEDLILMEAQQRLGQPDSAGNAIGLSEQAPLSDREVLTAHEVEVLRFYIDQYNDIIDAVVQAHNAAAGTRKVVVSDLHTLFDKLCSGQTEDGLDISGSYLSGGVFALDGVYLTARGNALVANAFIETINNFGPFNASIPTINVTTYKGVVYP